MMDPIFPPKLNRARAWAQAMPSTPHVPCQAMLSLAVAGRLGTAEVIPNQQRGYNQFRLVFLWGEGRRADFSHAARTQRERWGLGTEQHGQGVHTLLFLQPAPVIASARESSPQGE